MLFIGGGNGPDGGYVSYRLRSGRAAGHEVRRIADWQLKLAIENLSTPADPKNGHAVHAARRHIKKVRAAMRLVAPTLPGTMRSTDRRLQAASRLLAPIADGGAIIETFDRLGQRYSRAVPSRLFSAIRQTLVRRERSIDSGARRVLSKAANILRRERVRVARWRISARGSTAVAAGLERTFRRARKARVRALTRPTSRNFRRWRRRVKEHWLQVRLLEERCGGGLGRDRRRLEALDGWLGEHQNCLLLKRIVARRRIGRRQRQRALRAVDRYRTEMETRARRLSLRIYGETPQQFVDRATQLWMSQTARARARSTRPGWQRRAA